jgi:hypothetical protein
MFAFDFSLLIYLFPFHLNFSNMETAVLKKKLHQYIEEGDERFLGLVYALAKEYNNPQHEYEFSDNDIAMLEERRTAYFAGKNKASSWNEVKARVTGKVIYQ